MHVVMHVALRPRLATGVPVRGGWRRGLARPNSRPPCGLRKLPLPGRSRPRRLSGFRYISRRARGPEWADDLAAWAGDHGVVEAARVQQGEPRWHRCCYRLPALLEGSDLGRDCIQDGYPLICRHDVGDRECSPCFGVKVQVRCAHESPEPLPWACSCAGVRARSRATSVPSITRYGPAASARRSSTDKDDGGSPHDASAAWV